MQHRSLFYTQFFVLSLIGFLYILGLFLYLQWIFWWYDIMLHFLGGVWVALATYTALVALGKNPRLIHVLVAIALIGVAWEIFEVVIGAYRESNYAFDTTIDLIMDVLGSVLAFLVAKSVFLTEEV